MLKLTTRQTAEHQAVVGIEGRLDRETVGDLQALVALHAGDVTIDLAGLRAADDTGRDALIALRAAGHRLTGGSLYIKQLIEEARP